MQLKDILILLKNLAIPKGAILLERKEVLEHIISIVLHEANMRLVEVLTVIFENYVEDAVIVDAFVLQKTTFLLGGGDHRPEFAVRLAALAGPFGIAPRVAQFQYADDVALHVLELNCVDQCVSVAWNKAERGPLDRLIFAGATATGTILLCVFEDQSPKRLILFQCRLGIEYFRWRIGGCFEDFSWRSSADIGVAAIGLRPSLFEQWHPNLIFVGLAKDRMACLVDRHIIINDNLFYYSVDPQRYLVDPVVLAWLIPENLNNALLLFGQRSHSRQEIAISQGALKDILRLDPPIEEHRLPYDLRQSLPLMFLYLGNIAQTAGVRRKGHILPHILPLFVLLNQLSVVRALDLEDLHVGEKCLGGLVIDLLEGGHCGISYLFVLDRVDLLIFIIPTAKKHPYDKLQSRWAQFGRGFYIEKGIPTDRRRKIEDLGREEGWYSLSCWLGFAYFFYKLAKITSQLINLVTVMLQNSRRLLYCVSKNKNIAEELAKPVTGQPKHNGEVLNFGQYTFTPSIGSLEHADLAQIHDQAQKIYKWARDRKATHYSFLAYPHTGSICEKQEAFLNIKYVKNTVEAKPKELVEQSFTGKILIKGEGDGSSFPSGGLRATHTARGYTIWDPLSQLFIRRKKNLLYIPSLLVSHYGHALDDKTLFRQAEQILKRNTVELLNQLGIKTKSAVILLGLEQEFFAIEKASFDKREDLRFLGRAITGNVPPRNQQLGEHYYGKLPERVRVALLQVERELHEIGIPLKTKHNEVALNQFQICSICNDAGTAIDQNMITMEILKEVMEKHGLSALLHEKPFKDINGSGKHANWSLNYVKEDGTLKNLFATESNDSARDFQLFKLFILMNLKAVQKNHKLYLTAIATPGNEIRLGGHQAPPRIISVFLGTALANLLDGKEQKVEKNLRELISYLNFDVKQENTDRNRTSPYAYTGNRFEFRALGSSQNPSYAMAVIAATLSQEIQAVAQRLSKGESLESIIDSLAQETKQIRFEGNGYSEEWKVQAKKRGLYVNEVFSEIYSFMEKQQNVFEKLKICSKEETASRTTVVQQRYKQTVNIQQKTLILIADKHLLPRAYRHLHHIKGDFHSSILDREFTSYKKLVQEAIEGVNKVRSVNLQLSDELPKYQHLRELVEEVSNTLTKLTAKLPHDGECAFPDLYEFLKM